MDDQLVCDICCKPTTKKDGIVFTADTFRKIVEKGYIPDDDAIRNISIMIGAMIGMTGKIKDMSRSISREQIIDRWKEKVVATSKTNWLLCPSCGSKAREYGREIWKETYKNGMTYFTALLFISGIFTIVSLIMAPSEIICVAPRIVFLIMSALAILLIPTIYSGLNPIIVI